MNFSAHPDPAYGAMQHWMQQWSDLETQLAALLLAPQAQPDFAGRLRTLHGQARQLLELDADSTLYWLFQLAASSTVAYSASHAMVCWALCQLVADDLHLPAASRDSLALAALSMNLSMTRLQNTLAEQTTPLTDAQRAQVDTHAARSAQWLRELGVTDPLWLATVEQHHESGPDLPLPTRILQAMDRYAALISPRETRPGRCVTDSGRHAVAKAGQALDAVGHALLRTVGICPPGTFVRLADERVAVVLRRSGRPGEPWAATVLDAHDTPVVEPELIDTGEDGLGIAAALVTRSVRVRLNHPRLLQLSRVALSRH
ncbi:HD-GYP domain-containing protein [Aquabacterium sp. A08]|uniref:HD-GYP domain-containing protein n=1 Tax=Aquabacterium sp. A08 TaxID=2718532 RepID=UPI0014237625|nr:phosphodiesterase [Aquabacterium sp. A08]NIC40126.1 phosphodiesterase [Aquabacterium sp. A08]